MLFTSKELVAQFQDYYRRHDIDIDKVKKGKRWSEKQFCHYPIPECLRGTEGIWLLKLHHCLLDLVVSEEVQHACFFAGHVKAVLKMLPEEMDAETTNYFHWLYEKWHSAQTLKGGMNTFENNLGLFGISPEEKKNAEVKGGTIGGKISQKVMNSLTYISTATGFVCSAGPVACHNKSLGYPKDAKAKVPDEIAHEMIPVGRMAVMNPQQRKEAEATNARNVEIYNAYISKQ